MHRLATCPGVDPPEDVVLVEQPPADVLFLTSAGTDLTCLSRVLARPTAEAVFQASIRGLALDCLGHPAQLDHYLSSTAATARLIVVRLLGGRGHWSYGLEQLQAWCSAASDRELLILAGTADQDVHLHDLGSIDAELASRLAACLREGGDRNMLQMLEVLQRLLNGDSLPADAGCVLPVADPLPWDWQSEAGPRIGVVLYRALHQSGDLRLAEALNAELRRQGLCPRLLWVSSLRDAAVQCGVKDLLNREQVEVVICGTAFASVRSADAGFGSPLWDDLDLPVLQLLISGRSREEWLAGSRGLTPLDLTLQVVMPELDARLCTRPCGFRDLRTDDPRLATAIPGVAPDQDGIHWLVDHARHWVRLRETDANQRRVALVLANYPVRDGRLANGVGLDTPASCLSILHWLQQEGLELGRDPLPRDGEALMQSLLAGRTNAPESLIRPPLDHLSLTEYQRWWDSVPTDARERIEARWGPPSGACDMDPARGFPVHGLRFGHVVVLIQPDRGYDPDQIADLHSPDLPPPHRYLAQYLWLRERHGTHLMLHVGKHGSAEWLPGKSVGLSPGCAPQLALGAIPHLYPFIVNDPGEGSQAKRRGHAVVVDHLTPPLGRAGLHGPLQRLEGLLDELVEARQMGAARSGDLEQQVLKTLQHLDWPGLPDPGRADAESAALDLVLDAAETYLCELKEAQIRTGLHRLGTRPSPEAEQELLIALARPPSREGPGLTQALAHVIGLSFDPWSDEDGEPLCDDDRQLLDNSGCRRARRVGDGTAWLEDQAMHLVGLLVGQGSGRDLAEPIHNWSTQTPRHPVLDRLIKDLWPNLIRCGEQERRAVISGLAGGRVPAGPSGAPTRGRPDVLPTGRNFYSVDLRGLPTEAAWDLGRRSAEQLLDLHLLEEGEPLRHLALSVWGTATMRNGGEDIAQLLALIGVRPVWDGPTRRMVDLELIPLSLLGRPRVDVLLRISGLFRDAFPQLVAWVDRAQRLVAAQDEPGDANPLAELSRLEGPQGRIFGSAPGSYGAGLQAVIDSGAWEDRGDLAEAFLSWSQWRYEEGGEGVKDRSALESALSRVQVVLHNQDNREHDLLDSDDYYQFHGGLSAAVEQRRGQPPQMWFGDHSRRERPRLHRLEKEIDKVMRSRLLNPRWIEGMRQHGYKGAFEMGASLDYLFAYDAATDRVPDWCYGALSDQWLADERNVEFLMSSNPWVLRDMAERLLEAANRGLWQSAKDQQLQRLSELVHRSEACVEQGGPICSDP